MRRLTTVCCGLLAIFLLVSGRTEGGTKSAAPRSIHIDGDKVLRFISFLATGNAEVDSELKGKPKQTTTEIIIHDFEAMKQSTYKYDSDDPYFKLAIYSASGKVGADSKATPFYEATSLYRFLTELGLDPNDLALEGSYRRATLIDCEIDVRADFSTPNRFRCNITGPH